MLQYLKQSIHTYGLPSWTLELFFTDFSCWSVSVVSSVCCLSILSFACTLLTAFTDLWTLLGFFTLTSFIFTHFFVQFTLVDWAGCPVVFLACTVNCLVIFYSGWWSWVNCLVFKWILRILILYDMFCWLCHSFHRQLTVYVLFDQLWIQKLT